MPARADEIPRKHGQGWGSESSACPRLAHSAGSHRQSSGSLVVTHPFHPLNGQELAILLERKRPEGLVYVCEGEPPFYWSSEAEGKP
jgi:hypothetical protein